MESRNYTRGRPRGLDAAVYGRRLLTGPLRLPTPDASNTGYRNAPGYSGALTPWPGGPVAAGMTYAYYSFEGGQDIGTNADPIHGDVTFIGCRWFSAGEALTRIYCDGTVTFSYSSHEPDGTVLAPPVSNALGYQFGVRNEGTNTVGGITYDHCDMWGYANAIDVVGSSQALQQKFTNSWIHDARADGGTDHTDGIGSLQGFSGSYLTIDHNNIQGLGNTNAIAFQGGTWDHMAVTRNLLGGYGYTVHINDTTSNILFTDNVFSTLYPVGFGPLYDGAFATSAGSLWRRNKWLVPPGAAWGNPANNGKFWIPTAGNSPTDDSIFVSSSDFAG